MTAHGATVPEIAPGVAEATLNQITMLVTAEGNWVLPDSEEFRAALGDPQPDYDAVGFAVRNLGFVKFQVLDRLVTEIELHPRNVDLRALLAIERMLGEAATNLYRIKYLDDEWHSEISPSREHAMARLRELCAPILEPVATERFRSEEKDISELFDTEAGREQPLGRMALKWRVAFGVFDPVVMGIASNSELLPLFVVVGFEPSNGSPVLRFMGQRHRWAGDKYRLDGIGQPVEQMPDKEYGAWLGQFYRSVADTGQPRYDLVTAQMEYHAEPGRPRRTVSYERLLLPWRTPWDEALVTSCAKVLSNDAGANLRVSGSVSVSAKKASKSS